jgi:serine/threonine protein kinase
LELNPAAAAAPPLLSQFPSIKAIPFAKVFRPRTPADAVDFTSKLLIYRPASRLTAIEALCHPFMDELRAEGGRLPNGRPLPPLFECVLPQPFITLFLTPRLT